MSKYLVMAEGAAEQAIMDILLGNNALRFTRDDIIDNKVFRTLTINTEILRALGYQYDDKIKIIRILDKSKNMRIPAEYKHKLELPCKDCVTAPEIEVLYIIKRGDYIDFIQKSKGGQNKLKPSEYCKQKYGEYDKSYDFWKICWENDVNGLIDALRVYKSKSQGQPNIFYLYDLIKS